MAAPRNLASLKATIGYGGLTPGLAGVGLRSVSATLQSPGSALPNPSAPLPLDLDATMLRDPSPLPATGTLSGTATGRTTVLPRRKKSESTEAAEAAEVVLRPRFDKVRTLGEGAMGAVELVRDNDIRRTVAVKKVLPQQATESSLLRFADEVRIVGQLEHPSIVPIYDVGRDESGELYLVMKHLEGETMESIIEKLIAGEVRYRERFGVEHRVRLFLSVLDALRYAHARGILHRDLKPANIMIGPYGEVTVLDWGIAKPLAQRGDAGSAPAAALDRTALQSQDQRLLETQFGALAGTPLYMSPEQAAGRNDELDARSDVYSLTIMLIEWLTLRHPLEDKSTITEVLAATIGGDLDFDAIGRSAMAASVGMEYVYVFKRGIAQQPADRYQSVAELEQALKGILDGKISVQCHVTLAKHLAQRFTHWVDNHVMLYTLLFYGTGLGGLAALGYGAYRLVATL